MIDTTYITLSFTIIGMVAFTFMYWKDATSEGFSSDAIFDSIVLILIGGILGGKILFHPLTIDYYRYQFIDAQLSLEGVLIGGGLAAYYVVKKNKWDGWKVGDMIAPGLTLFQSLFFIGFWFRTELLTTFVLSLLFILLFLVILLAKKRMYIARSLSVSQQKRMEKLTFTGALISIYLTGSSLIAILFLVIHASLKSQLWWFQITFYLVIFTSSYILARKRMKAQNISMSSVLSNKFTSSILSKLKNRKKEIEKEEEHFAASDPFTQEYKSEGTRNMDDMEEEVNDVAEHENLQAEEKALKSEHKEVEETIEKIEKGEFGICETCGKEIEKKRLEAYPTAKNCIDCANKEDK